MPARAEEAAEVVLVAVGDVRLDGAVAELAARGGADYPVRESLPWLKGDILFGNLEGVVSDRGEKADKTWTFRAGPDATAVLTAAGFHVVSVANNHVFDFGPEAMLDTVRLVRAAGIETVGAGKDREEAEKPVVVERGGLKVAFLAFTSTFPKEAWAGPGRPGVAFGDPRRVAAAVREARGRADVVVVSFHGGTELDPEPNAVQKAFARTAVRAGADVVIGHHPHVLQPVEVIDGKVVLHSIGNFLFASPTPTTRATAAARIILAKDGVRRIEFVPFDVNEGRPLPGRMAEKAFDRLNRWAALTLHPGLLSMAPARD